MKYEKKLPTMAEITNWYLYKQENTPAEEERLYFSKIVAPDGARFQRVSRKSLTTLPPQNLSNSNRTFLLYPLQPAIHSSIFKKS